MASVEATVSSSSRVRPIEGSFAQRKNQFEKSTRSFAKEILNPKSFRSEDESDSDSRRTHYYHHHDCECRSFWDWWPRPYYVIHTGPSYRSRNSDATCLARLALGLAATAFGSMALYTVFTNWKINKEATKGLAEIHSFKHDFANQQESGQVETTARRSLNDLITHKERILKRMQLNARLDLIINTTIAVAASVLVTGAVIGSPHLAALGVAMALGFGTAKFVKLGLDSTSAKNIVDAQAILNIPKR